MNCFIQLVYANGSKHRAETKPNGNKDNIFPSRGWACSSAQQWIDSVRNGVKTANPVVRIDVVLEATGEIYNSWQV